jgi:hypothetical protein
MKVKDILFSGLLMGFICLSVSLFNAAQAQVDTTQVAKPDTAQIAQPAPAATQVAQPDTVMQEKGKEQKEKKDKKRKDEFIPYVGVNFNNISDLETDLGIGYHIGFDYKRGKFFYWQVGARFNNAVYEFTESTGFDTTGSVGIRSIDIPITGGINFLSALNRIVALRLFVSVAPGFALGVGDNDFGFTKDYIESFCMYAQGGIGVNVAFLVIEAGYNYGLTNVFEVDSKPGQIFVNLGFRF